MTFWEMVRANLADLWSFMGVFLVVLLAVAGIAAVLAALVLGLKVLALEPGCNQMAEEMGVVDGDYRLLSDTCWLTLPDGRKLPADQVRGVERLER